MIKAPKVFYTALYNSHAWMQYSSDRESKTKKIQPVSKHDIKNALHARHEKA